jgi:hypothetical protein
MVTSFTFFETERRSAFHKILMKTIEMVTTYILDPINSVYNYAKYSMYFDRLLYNGHKHESLKRGKYLGSISGEINDLKIGICCFSARHTALRVILLDQTP